MASPGSSSPHACAWNGDLAGVKAALKAGKLDVNAASSNARDDHGTMLHLAATRGHVALVSYLLAHGASVNAVDASRNSPLHRAAAYARNEVIRVLLQAGADPNVRNVRGKTPAMVASSDAAQRVLLDAQYDIIDAARAGDARKVRKFLAAGVSSSLTDIQGNTPLHAAATGNHLEVVQLLMAAQAEVNVLNLDGKYPRDLASDKRVLYVLQGPLDTERCLRFACELGNDHEVRRLLKRHLNLDVNAKDAMGDSGGAPALIIATRNGHTAVVETLLNHDADPNVANASERRPLHYAAERNDFCMTQVLLEHGASHLVVDSNQDTPVGLATDRRVIDMIRAHRLKNVAGPPSAPPSFGVSPRDLAKLMSPPDSATLKSLGGAQGLLAKLCSTRDGLRDDEVGRGMPERIATFGANDFASLLAPASGPMRAILQGGPKAAAAAPTAAGSDSGAAPPAVVASGVEDAEFVEYLRNHVERDVLVVRFGQVQKTRVADLVVGDVVDLAGPGTLVPADGVLLSMEGELVIDEDFVPRQGTPPGYQPKSLADNPFFFANSQVVRGCGRMLVTAVGVHSSLMHYPATLHYALMFGQLRRAQTMLESGEVNANIAMNSGRPLIFTLIDMVDAKTLTLLLDHGLNVNARNIARGSRSGEPGECLLASCVINNADLAPILLQRDNVRVHARDEVRKTALHWAVELGHTAIATSLIKLDASRIAEQDVYGCTPLHYAVLHGNAEITLLLAQQDATAVGKADAQGMTPLHYAAVAHRPQLLPYLLAAGADINAADALGRTPLMLCAIGEAEPVFELRATPDQPLSLTPTGQPIEPARARRLVLRCGDDIFPSDVTLNLYEYLVPDITEERLLTCPAILVKAGARVNAQDAAGNTALHYLIRALTPTPGHADFAKCERSFWLGVRAQDPLTDAVLKKVRLELAVFLTETANARMTLRNALGRTALSYFPKYLRVIRDRWPEARIVRQLQLEDALAALDPSDGRGGGSGGGDEHSLALLFRRATASSKAASHAAGGTGDAERFRVGAPVLYRQASAQTGEPVLIGRVVDLQGKHVRVFNLFNHEVMLVRSDSPDLLFPVHQQGSDEFARWNDVLSDLTLDDAISIDSPVYVRHLIEHRNVNVNSAASLIKHSPFQACLSRLRGKARLDMLALLLRLGADINAPDADGRTLVHFACTLGDPELLAWLAEHGARLDVEDRAHANALHYAALFNNVNVIAFLARSESTCDVDHADEVGDTPLHVAASRGHIDVVTALMAHGASTAAANTEGSTPFDVADETTLRVMLQHVRRPPGPVMLSAATCPICAESFSLANRRQQCRHCGRTVCSKDSTARRALPGFGMGNTPQRVCIQCETWVFDADVPARAISGSDLPSTAYTGTPRPADHQAGRNRRQRVAHARGGSSLSDDLVLKFTHAASYHIAKAAPPPSAHQPAAAGARGRKNHSPRRHHHHGNNSNSKAGNNRV